MDILAELKWRGLLHQMTDPALGDWLNKSSRTVYAGFDPTADSLHVGSLLPLLTLRRFQRAGHSPIALVGGATGMIGDPSGKSAERNLLSADVLQHNVDSLEQQMRGFLDFDGAHAARLVNNFTWMQGYSYLEFLRDVGKNFPVNVMLAKDSVKSRLDSESGLSYTEFSYMLLQGFDFVHLHREFGCELQIGGSDQWGNITAGIDLGRRMSSAQLYGATTPLLLTKDGRKMGKTEQGTVWLSAERTSPYLFYQYWIKDIEDDDAGTCLRFLTELPQEEIRELDESRQNEPHLRKSQRRLAEELTRMVHGDDGLARAERATQTLFGGDPSKMSDAELAEIFADVPSQSLPREQLTGDGLSLIEALVASTLAKNNSDARRTITQGGAYINNHRMECGEGQQVQDIRLTEEHLVGESSMVVRTGKKRYALLKFDA